MLRLAWLTDIHLTHLRHPGAAKSFGEYLAEETVCDAVIITGDISIASRLEYHLAELEAGLRCPVYFVLGNHDFYRGSFVGAQETAGKFNGWLGKLEFVELTPTVALVGCEGWYDALCGKPFAKGFLMSDWFDIAEFRTIVDEDILPSPEANEAVREAIVEATHDLPLETKQKIIAISRERSAQEAEKARIKLTEALKKYPWVVFATHFPPFEGACWHEGHQSGESWLPWFTSLLMGKMLLEVAQAHPDRRILVLCGHSHSSGIHTPANNLKVLTGEAVYGAPDVAGIFHIDSGIFVDIKLNKSWYALAPF